MKQISVLGIDLAKNVFQLHGVNERGQVVLRKQLKRSQIPALTMRRLFVKRLHDPACDLLRSKALISRRFFIVTMAGSCW